MSPTKYRKKPVVIEAMHWDGTAEAATPIINWALGNGVTISYHCPDGDACKRDTHVLMVMTLEGAMSALPGNWIIRGVQGEFYPCRDDIFAATYEAEEPATQVQVGQDGGVRGAGRAQAAAQRALDEQNARAETTGAVERAADPHHRVKVDFGKGSTFPALRLECTAPNDSPCRAVWSCDCEQITYGGTYNGKPIHFVWDDEKGDDDEHTGEFSTVCGFGTWLTESEDVVTGSVTVPVRLEWTGDEYLFHLIGGEGA